MDERLPFVHSLLDLIYCPQPVCGSRITKLMANAVTSAADSDLVASIAEGDQAAESALAPSGLFVGVRAAVPL